MFVPNWFLSCTALAFLCFRWPRLCSLLGLYNACLLPAAPPMITTCSFRRFRSILLCLARVWLLLGSWSLLCIFATSLIVGATCWGIGGSQWLWGNGFTEWLVVGRDGSGLGMLGTLLGGSRGAFSSSAGRRLWGCGREGRGGLHADPAAGFGTEGWGRGSLLFWARAVISDACCLSSQ